VVRGGSVSVFPARRRKAERRKSFSGNCGARQKRAIGAYPAAEPQKRTFYVLTLREGVSLRNFGQRSPLQRELDVVLLHEGILEPALASRRKR